MNSFKKTYERQTRPLLTTQNYPLIIIANWKLKSKKKTFLDLDITHC